MLDLDVARTETGLNAGARLVEVAVDAPGGPGLRTFTYELPAALAGIEPGEAVLVPFGKGGRQVLGVVVGEGHADPGVAVRPVAARVRGDGPLLGPGSLALARWVAGHYLAPLSVVIRAMLPPSMLERLELVAEVTPAGQHRLGAEPPDADAVELDLLAALAGRARAVRELVGPDGRAALMRRLRGLEARGWLELTWTLLGAAVGPRFERRVRLTREGLATADALAVGDRPSGRPVGPRQRDTLLALRTDPAAAPGSEEWVPAASVAERHGAAALAGLVRRGLAEAVVRERPRRPLASRVVRRPGARPAGVPLTEAQAAAVAAIEAARSTAAPRPLLLDGVTGGGKTAIYVEAIARALRAGRRALVLVPEIALATPLVDRLHADLDARIALVHSGLGAGERLDEWRRIRAGEVDLVVGTRTAVLAPVPELGLVIVDEEHDPAYKSDRTPRFQARDAALELGRRLGIPVVLGSATPAVESVWAAREGVIERIELPSRPVGRAPEILLVDLREELAAGNRGLLSAALVAELEALELAAGDRAILVINRRGTASVVLCRDCGHVQSCPDCERPLVFHQAGGTLRCHHCGRAAPLAARCPTCGSPRIRYLGGGTERLEREVRERLPRLRVGRLDRDVVERRGAADRVVDAFVDGELDVLVGTSLVTKALDIPAVTLVGVVSADIALNLPDERAAERTYQLLAQAVGRAGRGERPGRAVIQTYRPEHRAIRAVAEGQGSAFYDAELEIRRRWGSPPFGRLVKLTVAMADRDGAEAEARAMAARLRERIVDRGLDAVVSGPAPAYVPRRADRWRFNVIVRGRDPIAPIDGGLPAPWSVDVDPESLL